MDESPLRVSESPSVACCVSPLRHLTITMVRGGPAGICRCRSRRSIQFQGEGGTAQGRATQEEAVPRCRCSRSPAASFSFSGDLIKKTVEGIINDAEIESIVLKLWNFTEEGMLPYYNRLNKTRANMALA